MYFLTVQQQFSQQNQPRVTQLCCTSGQRQLRPGAIHAAPCLGEGQMDCGPQSAGTITGPGSSPSPAPGADIARESRAVPACSSLNFEGKHPNRAARWESRRAACRRRPSLCKAAAALPAGDEAAAACQAGRRRDSLGSGVGSCLPAGRHVPPVIPMESHRSSQPSPGSVGSQLRICLFTHLPKGIWEYAHPPAADLAGPAGREVALQNLH